MNQNKINFYNLQGRQLDVEAAIRLKESTQKDVTILKQKPQSKNLKIKLSELADDSLKSIQQDMCIRLSRFTTEAFAIKTEIKKIDRILKLRKVPLLDD